MFVTKIVEFAHNLNISTILYSCVVSLYISNMANIYTHVCDNRLLLMLYSHNFNTIMRASCGVWARLSYISYQSTSSSSKSYRV